MGRRAAGPSAPVHRDVPRAFALLVATVLALALWVLLVLVAVGFGRDARLGGGASDWTLTGFVSLVAVGVLYLVMSLLLRARVAWRGRSPAGPVVGRHRK